MSGAIRLSIDTGGTFTDAVMDGPDGARRFVKVLSSSSLRARVLRVHSPRAMTVDVAALAPPNGAAFILGWRVRGAGVHGVVAAARDDDGGGGGIHIELDPGLSEGPRGSTSPLEGTPPGSLIDLRAPWPAPILAARLLLGRAPGEALPPIAIRLGTTRGTNAMLEGRFDSVLLVANDGLGEALEIGDQRRDRLFDPAPRRRPPIHRAAIEVSLRQDAQGRVIAPLDEESLRAALEAARHRHGVTHAAVLLMHAWRNPEPERRVADIVRRAGFVRVVASHECSGTEGYLPRGSATVADAALSSAVGDFLDAVRRELAPGSTLEVATSAAALRPAEAFPPRESLLSGPAGGAAAVLDIARRLDDGTSRAMGASSTPRHDDRPRSRAAAALGFDMGGTSTDALRVADRLPRREETPIAGRSLAVPSVVIESVAAGGGSVCVFEHGVLRVGPESAGSEPGPACYGRGGPLTVTDVDLLLGRADPSRFAVPLDIDRSRRALRELCERQQAAGVPRNEMETLETLRGIADEAMASALRVISAREGFDPAAHALVSFGGAGGQHACAVAERLGIRRIVHPRAAGLLSALGMNGLRRERVRSEGVHGTLSSASLCEAVARGVEALEREPPPVARAVLRVDHVEAAVGWRGQSAVVEIMVEASQLGGDGTSDAALAQSARARYRAMFGADPPQAPADLATVRVIASWVEPLGIGERARHDSNDRRRAEPSAPGVRRDGNSELWSHGRRFEARLVDRVELRPGDVIEGPAIVADEHATLVIDVGWAGRVDDAGAIVLDRRGDDIDDVPAVAAPEIRAAALASIAVEMGEQLRRTAVSVNVRDRLDYSCGILDAQGRLATTAPHVPVHLGALGACVRTLIEAHPMRAGDLVVTNDPAFGGSHLPDVTVIMAVGDDDGTTLAFVAARAHHAEIGGVRPGSMPPSARVLDEEGVVIPPTLVGRAETVDLSPIERLLRSAPHPSRAVDDNLADLSAAVAALRRGAALIRAFVADHGRAALEATLGDLRHHARDRVAEAIARLAPDFDRVVEQRLDDGWRIRLRLARDGDRLRVDLSGSDGVHPHNLNAPLAVARSAVMYALRVLVESHERQDERTLPLNDGLLEPIDLVVPAGFLNPTASSPPAAVAAGNTETSQRLVDALLLGLGVAACSQGTMNNLVMGGVERTHPWSFYETIAGGHGATPSADGAAGLHAHMTNTRITDPETLERRFPLRLRRFSFRRGSGGDGAHRGGDGLMREIELLAPAEVSFVSQRRASGPEGIFGGASGSCGAQSILRADGSQAALEGRFELEALPGDRLLIETPGGGGCGR